VKSDNFHFVIVNSHFHFLRVWQLFFVWLKHWHLDNSMLVVVLVYIVSKQDLEDSHPILDMLDHWGSVYNLSIDMRNKYNLEDF